MPSYSCYSPPKRLPPSPKKFASRWVRDGESMPTKALAEGQESKSSRYDDVNSYRENLDRVSPRSKSQPPSIGSRLRSSDESEDSKPSASSVFDGPPTTIASFMHQKEHVQRHRPSRRRASFAQGEPLKLVPDDTVDVPTDREAIEARKEEKILDMMAKNNPTRPLHFEDDDDDVGMTPPHPNRVHYQRRSPKKGLKVAMPSHIRMRSKKFNLHFRSRSASQVEPKQAKATDDDQPKPLVPQKDVDGYPPIPTTRSRSSTMRGKELNSDGYPPVPTIPSRSSTVHSKKLSSDGVPPMPTTRSRSSTMRSKELNSDGYPLMPTIQRHKEPSLAARQMQKARGPSMMSLDSSSTPPPVPAKDTPKHLRGKSTTAATTQAVGESGVSDTEKIEEEESIESPKMRPGPGGAPRLVNRAPSLYSLHGVMSNASTPQRYPLTTLPSRLHDRIPIGEDVFVYSPSIYSVPSQRRGMTEREKKTVRFSERTSSLAPDTKPLNHGRPDPTTPVKPKHTRGKPSIIGGSPNMFHLSEHSRADSVLADSPEKLSTGYRTPVKGVGHHTPAKDVGHHAPAQEIGHRTPAQDVVYHTTPEHPRKDSVLADSPEKLSTGYRTPVKDVGHHTLAKDVGHHAPAQEIGHHTVAQEFGHHTPAAQDVVYHTTSEHSREDSVLADSPEKLSTSYRTPAKDIGHYTSTKDVGHYTVAKDFGHLTPAQGFGHHTPAQYFGHHAPAQDVGYHTPAQNIGHHTPAKDFEYRTPSKYIGHHAPAQGIGHHTPAKDMSATPNGKTTTPGNDIQPQLANYVAEPSQFGLTPYLSQVHNIEHASPTKFNHPSAIPSPLHARGPSQKAASQHGAPSNDAPQAASAESSEREFITGLHVVHFHMDTVSDKIEAAIEQSMEESLAYCDNRADGIKEDMATRHAETQASMDAIEKNLGRLAVEVEEIKAASAEKVGAQQEQLQRVEDKLDRVLLLLEARPHQAMVPWYINTAHHQ
ncbi:hypothetical protein IWZ01DRAFT_238825 [Phyllosticta capitalensis]